MAYVLFSRAGFTEAVQRNAKMSGARIVTLADVEASHVRFVAGTASLSVHPASLTAIPKNPGRLSLKLPSQPLGGLPVGMTLA